MGVGPGVGRRLVVAGTRLGEDIVGVGWVLMERLPVEAAGVELKWARERAQTGHISDAIQAAQPECAHAGAPRTRASSHRQGRDKKAVDHLRSKFPSGAAFFCFFHDFFCFFPPWRASRL